MVAMAPQRTRWEYWDSLRNHSDHCVLPFCVSSTRHNVHFCIIWAMSVNTLSIRIDVDRQGVRHGTIQSHHATARNDGWQGVHPWDACYGWYDRRSGRQ